MPSLLRIVHCLRAPVGGLFRHVCDLAMRQAELGHNVGIMADSKTSDLLTHGRLRQIEPHLTLGLHLVPMSRKPGFGDLAAARALARFVRQTQASILHGHGAKGGAYARLAARSLVARGTSVTCFYTPHGGSLHFDSKSLEGRIYHALERYLAGFTDGVLFESDHARRLYDSQVGIKRLPARVVANGLHEDEFVDHKPLPSADDFLFVGELRHLKGVDVMLHALARCNRFTPTTATFIGDGPDAKSFQDLARQLNLGSVTRFPGPEPAQQAFPRGRCLVVPSRAESFPYVVLEAGAVGMPLIATNVGGIPEITSDTAITLIPPDDTEALANAMTEVKTDPQKALKTAKTLNLKVANTYTVAAMTDAIVEFYNMVSARRIAG